jgi:hypothetical protein
MLPHEGVDAIQQVVKLEGFAQVVVDTHRAATANVVGRVPGGQHENGRLLPATTDIRRNLKPVSLRQHEVEEVMAQLEAPVTIRP